MKKKYFCDFWDRNPKKAMKILAIALVLIAGIAFCTACAVTINFTGKISTAAIVNGLAVSIITEWIISFGGTLWLCFSRNRKKKNQKGSN